MIEGTIRPAGIDEDGNNDLLVLAEEKAEIKVTKTVFDARIDGKGGKPIACRERYDVAAVESMKM